MDASGQSKSIRVAVRVRPQLPSDGAAGTSLLQVEPSRPNEVLLASSNDRRTAKRYTFDQVFGPDVPQKDLYTRAGVDELVAAVVAGYHATIFAYGQTGSGKTYTMEGYRYTAPGGGNTTGTAGSGPASGTGPVGRAGPSGGSGGSGGGVPAAHFSSTPDEQLGVTPRAVRELFEAVGRQRDRRFCIKCSFVQIYREQVYDLLNPATLGSLPGAGGGGGPPRRVAGVSGVAVGGPLRLRWSAAEEFYLENLFTLEVETADEALSAFQTGVANKVMASHRLNAASSRSHCLFSLVVSSAPVASPLELTTARLTLVDLAGSERAALTGATEGSLRDEAVSINKSLFTLRQVITALTDAAAAATTAASAAAAGGPPPTQPPHVPYRDSKLTCLLKHSLGGNSLALMLACLAPLDRFVEENASTLEYAARARRITNTVAVNEDPRSRLIRELRAEVAFLRSQLAAAAVEVPPHEMAAAATHGSQTHLAFLKHLPRNVIGNTSDSNIGTASRAGAGGVGTSSSSAAAAAGGGGTTASTASDTDADEAAVASRLRTTDVEVLVRAVIDASRVAVSSFAALNTLRTAYGRTTAQLEALRVQYDNLATDDVRLRDRLALLEGLVGERRRGRGGGDGGGGWDGGRGGEGEEGSGGVEQWHTAATAALIELEELRRENALLHERLQLLEPDRGATYGHMAMTSSSTAAAAAGRPTRTPLGRTGPWAGGSLTGPLNTRSTGGGAAAGRLPSQQRPVSTGGGGWGAPPSRGANGVVQGPPGSAPNGRRPPPPLPPPSSVTSQQPQPRRSGADIQRAHSAGVLIRSSGGGGGNVRQPTTPVATPFTPQEVLRAVPPLAGATAAGSGGGWTASGSSSFGGGGGGSSGMGAAVGQSSGGGGSSRGTLTVEQLRSVLQMSSGGGGAMAGAPSAGGASAAGALDAAAGRASGRPPPSSTVSASGMRPNNSSSGGGGSGPGNTSTSTSSNSAAAVAGRLSELSHVVASRALGSSVRLSTTGQLLPAAPARMAVEAAAAAAGGPLSYQGVLLSPRPATVSGGSGGLGGGPLDQRPTGRRASSSMVIGGGGRGAACEGALGPDGMMAGSVGGTISSDGAVAAAGVAVMSAEATLAQLLAERNALTRQRLADGH